MYISTSTYPTTSFGVAKMNKELHQRLEQVFDLMIDEDYECAKTKLNEVLAQVGVKDEEL